ncbi:unnamed protein product [Cylicostephanus goldi]|uniref:TGS domain-containing protein n=1 Tax=Cylicostephanus goldi TaxID=71465 RepID=A0A3P7LSN9_CYLGO|nr:unnamed protein product [Cylicostephanus goldi]
MSKIDQISIEELDIIYRIPHCVPISAHHKWNFDDLLEKMWQYLNLIRIYTKPRGQLPDYSAPIVLNAEKNTVDDLCLKIHKSLQKDFKAALVWGASAKHNPQRVGKEHVLFDEDVVQILKRALVWGASAKHNPQRVGKEHVLFDEDVVQILKRYVSIASYHTMPLIIEFLQNLMAKIMTTC